MLSKAKFLKTLPGYRSMGGGNVEATTYSLDPPLACDGLAIFGQNRASEATVFHLTTSEGLSITGVRPTGKNHNVTDAYDSRWLAVPENLSDQDALARIGVELVTTPNATPQEEWDCDSELAVDTACDCGECETPAKAGNTCLEPVTYLKTLHDPLMNVHRYECQDGSGVVVAESVFAVSVHKSAQAEGQSLGIINAPLFIQDEPRLTVEEALNKAGFQHVASRVPSGTLSNGAGI